MITPICRDDSSPSNVTEAHLEGRGRTGSVLRISRRCLLPPCALQTCGEEHWIPTEIRCILGGF